MSGLEGSAGGRHGRNGRTTSKDRSGYFAIRAWEKRIVFIETQSVGPKAERWI